MWTKKFLTEAQNYHYRKYEWFWNEFNKFSERTSNLIASSDKDEVYKQYPAYISFSLTYKCNLACPMCFQFDRPRYDGVTSLEKYISIAEEIESWNSKPWITLWGGEPTLNKDFREIYYAFLKAAGLLAICTNGTLLRNYFDLIKSPLSNTFWVISIDGLQKTHDLIRGKGTFDKIIENLKEAIRLRNEFKTNNLFGVEITVLKENVRELPALCDYLIELGIDWIVINHRWYTSRELIDKYEIQLEEYQKYRFSNINSAEGFYSEETELPDPEELFKYIELAKEKVNDRVLLFTMPDFTLEGLINHYKIKVLKEEKFKCYKNLVKLDFDTHGNAVPCKQFPDIRYGNYNTEKIETIWKGSKRMEIAQKLINSNKFHICQMCPDKALSIKYN